MNQEQSVDTKTDQYHTILNNIMDKTSTTQKEKDKEGHETTMV